MTAVGFQELEFVGRQRELGAVLEAMSGPGVVLVSGVAGMGKSRLLAEVMAQRPGPAIFVRAFLPERDEAWALGRSLLRDASERDPKALAAVPARAAAALAEVVPELAHLIPDDAGRLDPESRRALALEGGVRLLAAVTASGTPLVVDDLQWADPTSLRLLGLLTRRVPELSLLLAFRSEDAGPDSAVTALAEELSRSGMVRSTVSLEPLSQKALEDLLGGHPLAGTIAAETDGTPLAVTEVLRAMTARGVFEVDPTRRWRPLGSGTDVDGMAREVSRSGQRRAIQARAARETPRRREVLSLLALLGREIPARLLALATRAEEADVVDDLQALDRSGLARLGDAGWTTAHDVIGEAVVAGLERAERGRLHHRLARVLEHENKDSAETARHLAGSGDTPAAAAAFARAARESLDRCAGEEAVARAEAGLALDPVPAVRRALLEIRAEGKAIAGDMAAAREDLRGALRDEPAGPRRSRLLARLAMWTGGAEDYAEASELVELALTAAAGDLEARAEALVVGAVMDLNCGRIEAGEARAGDALVIFRQLGDESGVARVLDLRAIAAWVMGNVDELADLSRHVAHLYRDCGKLLAVGEKLGAAGWIEAIRGRPEQGLPDCQEALELERMLGQREGVALALWARSEVFSVLGRVDEARADAEECLAISRAMGHQTMIAVALRGLGLAQQSAGDLHIAAATLREAVEASRGRPIHLAWGAGRLASVLMETEDLEGAEEAARLCLDQAIPGGGFDGALVMAELALIREDPGARSLAVEAIAFAEARGWRWGGSRQRLERRLAAAPAEEQAFEARRERRTFMFTDIVGSTNLVETLGDEAWGHLLRWHDQTLRTLFAHHHGEEVKQVGDGFFVAFVRPADGVACAVAIQRALDRHRRDHGFAPSVRIGLHEAEATREADDYKGIGVHEAARIGALAAAGEIVAGGALALHAGVQAVSDPRLVSLKGISEPVEIVSIDWR